MSSLAPLDLSDLDLPFQLPPSNRSPDCSAAAAAAAPLRASAPSTHRPAPASPALSVAPCPADECLALPHASTCTCSCQSRARTRPPTVKREPAMAARKKRASPSDPPPPLAPAVSRPYTHALWLSDLPADLVPAPLRAAVAASRLIRIGASSRSADKGGAALASPRLARAAAGARVLVRDSQWENNQVYTRTLQPSLPSIRGRSRSPRGFDQPRHPIKRNSPS